MRKGRVIPGLALLLLCSSGPGLAGDPSSLVVFLIASLDRVLVLRLLESGAFELIDPRPALARMG